MTIEFISTIEELVKVAKFKAALDLLADPGKVLNKDIRDKAILLLGQLAKTEKDFQMDLLTDNEYRKALAKMSGSILYLVGKEVTVETTTTFMTKTTTSTTMLVGFSAIRLDDKLYLNLASLRTNLSQMSKKPESAIVYFVGRHFKGQTPEPVKKAISDAFVAYGSVTGMMEKMAAWETAADAIVQACALHIKQMAEKLVEPTTRYKREAQEKLNETSEAINNSKEKPVGIHSLIAHYKTAAKYIVFIAGKLDNEAYAEPRVTLQWTKDGQASLGLLQDMNDDAIIKAVNTNQKGLEAEAYEDLMVDFTNHQLKLQLLLNELVGFVESEAQGLYAIAHPYLPKQ